jgi:AcrR family transcriptional regulator
MFESENPSSIRSKKLIIEALIDLMKESQFNKITIQEIAYRANVDRRTFYRHFSSKEEIMQYHIMQLGKDHQSKLQKEEALTFPIIARLFCETALSHKELILLLIDHNLFSLLLGIFNKVLLSNQNAVRDKFLLFKEGRHRDYAFSFYNGGFWNVIQTWLKNDADASPTEIAEILTDLIKKMME